jgi:hypothetical protein
VILPGEVRAADHVAVGRADLELESRRRELPAMEDHAAAGLAHALAAPVGEEHGPGSTAAAGGAGDVEEPRAEGVVGEQAQTQRRVQDHDGGLVRQRTSQVEGRPHRVGHLNAVELDHLVVTETGHMAAEHPAGVVPGSRTAGHVDPVERNVPQRQTQEDRGRLVTDHRGPAKSRQRGLDQ